MPISFKENTPKEELVLEHVLVWQSQFASTYNSDRQLLLCPKNEAGVLKFVCTTIRPTKLPFKYIYNWEPCAKFLANYLEFEELEFPDQLPAIVPAPSNILNWQSGDCFDFSILLCSLLIGNGYDAFCVYGKAPREITTRDESMLPCPIMDLPQQPTDEQEEILAPGKEVQNNTNVEELKTKIEEPQISRFDEGLRQKVEEEKILKEKFEKDITDDEPEYEKADPYKDKRMHCWVLIKRGKRDIKENFFIEPSTGRKYAVKESPYLTIECIFNNRNFWVNMKPDLAADKVGIDEFDVKEESEKEWEYVMIPTIHKKVL